MAFAHGAQAWAAADAATTVYTISGLAFQPKALRFYGVGIASATDAASATAHSRRFLGFATGTSDRRCVGSQSQDAVGTQVCTTGYQTDCVAMTLTSTPAADGKLDLGSITSDGFTLVVDDATPVDMTVFWEAWGGADITVAVTGEISEPASTGDVDYTVTGFVSGATDQVVMFGGQQGTAESVTRNDASLMVGFAGPPVPAVDIDIADKTFSGSLGSNVADKGVMVSFVPDEADATISFVAAGTFDAIGGGASGPAPGNPTGVAVGDLKVLVFYGNNVTTGTVSVAGWTQIVNDRDGSGGLLGVWTLTDNGEAAPTISVTNMTTSDMCAQIGAWRPSAGGIDLDETGVVSVNATGNTTIGPIAGVTVQPRGFVVVVGGGRIDGTGGAVLTGDGLSWAELGDDSSGADNGATMVWDYAIHTAPAIVNVMVMGNDDDNSATSDTDGYCQTGECLGMHTVAGGNPSARAECTQWGTNNFRLNWIARATSNRKYIFLAIKGGTWAVGALSIDGSAGSATATVSGLAFTPVGMSLIGRMTAEQTAGTASAEDRVALGTGSSTSSRRTMSAWSENGNATASEIDTIVEYDQVLAYPAADGTVTAAKDINAMNADGFQLIVDTTGGVASEWIGFLTFGTEAEVGGRTTKNTRAFPLGTEIGMSWVMNV